MADRGQSLICHNSHAITDMPFIRQAEERIKWRIEGGTGYVRYSSKVRLRLVSSSKSVLTICGNASAYRPSKLDRDQGGWQTRCAHGTYEVGIATY